MVLLGIVGAEKSLAKLVLGLLQKHSDQYQVIFKVDRSYENSHIKSEFSDVDDALLMLTPTLVLDFGEPETAFERTKIYRDYFVAAVMFAPALTKEQLEQLQALRRAPQRSMPSLVIENEVSISLNNVVLQEQVMQTLNVLGPLVSEVNIELQNAAPNFHQRYMPLMKMINNNLGVNEQAFPSTFNNRLMRSGKVQICVLSMSVDGNPADEEINVRIILAEKNVGLGSLTYAFDNHSVFVWRGLSTLLDYLTARLASVNGEIQIDLLPKLVRQCWQ